jgi:hypothetical protein
MQAKVIYFVRSLVFTSWRMHTAPSSHSRSLSHHMGFLSMSMKGRYLPVKPKPYSQNVHSTQVSRVDKLFSCFQNLTAHNQGHIQLDELAYIMTWWNRQNCQRMYYNLLPCSIKVLQWSICLVCCTKHHKWQ